MLELFSVSLLPHFIFKKTMNKTVPTIPQILQNLNISTLNEMQLATIEANETEQDILLRSPTGTGKTLAFLLPLYSRLKPHKKVVQAVVLVPTRELALQVTSVVKAMKIPFKITCCYGGHPVRLEKKDLQNPPAILVATPGRLADHIRRDHINISQARTLVLDEFDKSLTFGFQKEMAYIIEELPLLQKRILTSATNALQVPSFVGLRSPIKLDFSSEKEQNPQLELKLVKSLEKDKLNTLYELICNLKGESMIVFCNFRETVERVSQFLHEKKVVHDYFHGGLEQIEREKTLSKFRNGTYQVLISTDVTARGLDIPEIQYIVHYHLPTKEHVFVHRNGRTARMHATGTVFLLQYVDEQLPEYLAEIPETFELQSMPPPPKPDWVTLNLNKGKKEKVSKGDVVGFLIKKGGLESADIGVIEIRRFFSLVAVRRKEIPNLLKKVGNEKIKGKKVRVTVDK